MNIEELPKIKIIFPRSGRLVETEVLLPDGSPLYVTSIEAAMDNKESVIRLSIPTIQIEMEIAKEEP